MKSAAWVLILDEANCVVLLYANVFGKGMNLVTYLFFKLASIRYIYES